MHQEARELLAGGIDPSADKRERAEAEAANSQRTLQIIGEEWLTGPHAKKVEPTTVAATARLLRRNLLEHPIGERPMADVKAPELLAALRDIEARGADYSAHKVLQVCGQIWRYAIASGRAERDITADLRGALMPHKTKHMPAITNPTRLGDLLRAIDSYSGSPLTQAALKLSILFFVRPGEIRRARWSDIDLVACEWRYFITKTKVDHIVPLCRQAVEILQSIQPLTGHQEYVFSGARSKSRPMSENTTNSALRYLGFDGSEVVAHGLRAMARTILDEVLQYPPHVVEQQLAHAERDPLGRAYNRTAHLPQRREMMQAWADYLDRIKNGATILPFLRTA